MEKCVDNWISAIKSEATKKIYIHYMKKFLEWVELKDEVSILRLDDSQIQELLQNYLIHQKARLAPSSLAPMFSAIQLFLVMNDRIAINFKKLKKMFPSNRDSKTGSEAWSTEDIQSMLNVAKTPKVRALIHFLASTACRVGAVSELRLKHVTDIERCKAVEFYPNTKDSYFGFLTPEASKALDEYLQKRQNDSEILTKESPLFRQTYQHGKEPARPLSKESIQVHMWNAIRHIPREKQGRRYNIQLDHGFRKRWNTIVKSNDIVNLTWAEKLMGHSVTIPLDNSYVDGNKEKFKQLAFKEFGKHIVNLTIDDSERLRLQSKIKDEKISKLETEKDAKISELENKLKNHTTTQKETDDKVQSLEEMTRQLAERLQKQESMNNEINKIHIKIKDTINRESDPSNPHFPDGNPLDTRLVNLELQELDEKSMTIFDSEFEESINVVVRKNKVYCTLDRSTKCKHVLFALGNPDFYRIIKKNNVDILFPTTS